MFEGTKHDLSVARGATVIFRERPSLLAFPFGAVVTIVVAYAVLVRFVLLLGPGGPGVAETIALLIAFYLVAGFLWTFFTAGLIYSTGRHLRGEDVSIGAGLCHAGGVIPLIARWTLVKLGSGSIALSTSRTARRIAHALCSSSSLGLDWRHVRYLVLPTAVFERPDGVAETVDRAADVLERSSAEDRPNVVGAVMLIAVPVVVALLIVGTVGGGVLAPWDERTTIGAAVVLAFGRLGLAFVLALTLDAVVKTGIYIRHVDTRSERSVRVSTDRPDSGS